MPIQQLTWLSNARELLMGFEAIHRYKDLDTAYNTYQAEADLIHQYVHHKGPCLGTSSIP